MLHLKLGFGIGRHALGSSHFRAVVFAVTWACRAETGRAEAAEAVVVVEAAVVLVCRAVAVAGRAVSFLTAEDRVALPGVFADAGLAGAEAPVAAEAPAAAEAGFLADAGAEAGLVAALTAVAGFLSGVLAVSGRFAEEEEEDTDAFPDELAPRDDKDDACVPARPCGAGAEATTLFATLICIWGIGKVER